MVVGLIGTLKIFSVTYTFGCFPNNLRHNRTHQCILFLIAIVVSLDCSLGDIGDDVIAIIWSEQPLDI